MKTSSEVEYLIKLTLIVFQCFNSMLEIPCVNKHYISSMGNEASLPMNCPAFDSEEIKRLGKRFKKLDLDGSGSLSIEEFMSLPELQQNPLVRRVIGKLSSGPELERFYRCFSQIYSMTTPMGKLTSKSSYRL